MILGVIFGVAAFVFLLLGAISVWTRDERPPMWVPPEPRRIEGKPFYDWQEHEDGE